MVELDYLMADRDLGRYRREQGSTADRVLAGLRKKFRIVQHLRNRLCMNRIHSTFTIVSSLYPVITLV